MGQTESARYKYLKSTVEIRHVLVIQRWFRGYRARLMRRYIEVWSILEMLEYSGEQDQADLFGFYLDLLKYMPRKRQGTQIEFLPRKSHTLPTGQMNYIEKFDNTEFAKYEFEPMQFPLQVKDFHKMLTRVLNRKKKIFPPSFVHNVMVQAIIEMAKLPNINMVSTASAQQVTVVGDIHGSMEDLLLIFHRNGYPSALNPYVFNGDYVDRGEHSVEVLCMILVAFLVYPKGVFINRGNHEDLSLNQYYGFTDEIQRKYKKYSKQIFDKVNELYRWLPLGTIIDDKIFIVHGGISETTDVKILKQLNRQDYCSVLHPSDQINVTEWKQIVDILWSDPMEGYGCVSNVKRNAGMLFGFDVTTKFLNSNKFKCLIRSHECKNAGYAYNHGKRVITIFSRSNYYGKGSNCGAFIKLDTSLTPTFHKFMVSNSESDKKASHGEDIIALEKTALVQICVRLRATRREIELGFKKFDEQNKGFIYFRKWISIMEEYSSLKLPWMSIRKKLAPKPPKKEVPVNNIYYVGTLKLLDTDEIVKAAAAFTTPIEMLAENREALVAIFKVIDRDNSGGISTQEFEYVIDMLTKHKYTQKFKEKLLKACKNMDLNNDGIVELDEFLEAFRRCARPQPHTQNE